MVTARPVAMDKKTPYADLRVDLEDIHIAAMGEKTSNSDFDADLEDIDVEPARPTIALTCPQGLHTKYHNLVHGPCLYENAT